ncbi:alanine racemase [Paenibacillus cymbidii]|uniref:alanine racemase n=1 Tax=Paenibacillus cymbidii TaxID=1639034 RepID=UPI001436C1EC|nr:alanine racemase [Paenibacillus cymbidii]
MRQVADGHVPESIDTPAVCIRLDALERNLERMAALAAGAGVRFRPHIKTHKCVWIAQRQLTHGAAGITAAKLGEAEVMAAAGIDDILLAYPLTGASKLQRLAELLRHTKVAVSADHPAVVRGLSDLGESLKRRIPLYVDVNTGLNRCGREPGEDSAALVRHLSRYPGIEVRGLMTHAGHAAGCSTVEEIRRVARHEAESLVMTQRLLRESGIDVPEISVGSSLTAAFIGEQSGVTELRAGAYVFADRGQLAHGMIAADDCAMLVAATVVSMPRPGTAIIDAGSKTFSSDPNRRLPGYGQWVDDGRVVVERLNEEHGMLRVPGDVRLNVGQRMQFIPNHCCAVSNLHDRLYGIRNGKVARVLTVDGRGRSQ